MSPALVTAEIMDLFVRYGAADYDGEPVSQAAHMIQCGLLAEEATGDPELVVGAFLHDIGHLLKHHGHTASMDGFGVVDHEGQGAALLAQRGFSKRVCAVVAGHVSAKRYLVATRADYRGKLSEASLQTLAWQGGPMNADEAARFEQQAFFTDIIQVRLWDELGKDAAALTPPVNYFEPIIFKHLTLQAHYNEAVH